MKIVKIALGFAIACSAGCQHRNVSQPAKTSFPAPPGYVLTWHDEFEGQNGSAPDASKWTYDIGVDGDGWGNRELEYYTKRPDNVEIRDGNLVIVARQETYTGADGITRNYTSARLKTEGIFAQAYGRFEARIKLPAGQGIWPAFWMLGDNISKDGWPKSGEIDIMENIGKEPATNHASLHGPSATKPTSDLTALISLAGEVSPPSTASVAYGQEQSGGPIHVKLPARGRLSDDFHLYAIEWEPQVVRFYFDKELYATFTSAQWPPDGTWVFDHPFFLILNVAVGGDWPGSPDATSIFPQKMYVDYVRVYQREIPR
jgi:beta-glucanase (GH16 family)